MADQITRRDLLTAAGTVGAVGGGAVGVAGLLGLAGGAAPETEHVVTVVRLGEKVPSADPEASAWDRVEELRAPLLAQRLVPPALESVGVAELRVRAATDGKTIGFRLSWDDTSVDDLDGVDRYHDAVAVMLPTTPGKPPAITMGSVGAPVHILQWRATWERDLAGKSGVDQIFPRVVHDVMPDDVLPDETAALYWVGREAGNPLSQTERTTPVEQVVAEGFGTTTHLGRDDAHGHGIHDGKRWTVALGFPRARPGIGAPLQPGAEWSVAFAVWLGERQNRGGRKHYVAWLPLRFEGT